MISLSAIMMLLEIPIYINDIVQNYISTNPIEISDDSISSASRVYVPATETINNILSEQLIVLGDKMVNLVYSKVITDEYNIDLDKFNIANNNTNAKATTKGINEALKYAREQGYKKAILPAGEYLIETDTIQETKSFVDIEDSTKGWASHLKGIIIPDNIEFDITNCILTLKPNVNPHQTVITFANSDNAKLTGGTIIGDRDTHLFDLVINKNGDELESGGFDDNTGLPIEDSTKMRTKGYISSISSGDALPSQFVICPLANTSKNTVDGGCRYIYCYDANNNYLGKATGNNSFLTRACLPKGTAKIKVSFKNETRTDAKYYLSTEKIYITFERSNGIVLFNSNNVTISNTIVKNFITDAIGTMPMPINHSNNNLQIINCTLENNRRQGISLVGTSNGVLIKDTIIKKTQGVDPQCGIDIEHYSYVKNVVIDNCTFEDNKKWDIINYNGYDIEIKNTSFNGGIASTNGYNMDIHNNSFSFYDNPEIKKASSVALMLDVAMSEDTSPYFKIYDNTIMNYESASSISSSSLKNSIFKNNTITNCNVYPKSNSSYNKYYNSNIYMTTGFNYDHEYYNNCIITGANKDANENNGISTNAEIVNCQFTGSAIIKNSTITMSDKSFITKWGYKYIFDNCNINTAYTSDIPFITSHGCDGASFVNCTMNLSCTPFIALNYKSITIDNCNIAFNDSYKGTGPLLFYKNVYGSASFTNNKFYKSFDTQKIILPESKNSTINNVPFTAGTY